MHLKFKYLCNKSYFQIRAFFQVEKSLLLFLRQYQIDTKLLHVSNEAKMRMARSKSNEGVIGGNYLINMDVKHGWIAEAT